jgi:hypothetical protein
MMLKLCQDYGFECDWLDGIKNITLKKPREYFAGEHKIDDTINNHSDDY